MIDLTSQTNSIYPDEIKPYVFHVKVIMETQRAAFRFETDILADDKDTAAEIAIGKAMLYEMNHKDRYLRINEIHSEAKF